MLRFYIEFFEEEGSRPIEEFLINLPKKDRAKVLQLIALLEEKGTQMPYSYCKKLSHSALWELKIKYRTNAYRILFFYHCKTIVLLHGFSKKTDETPSADLRLAEKRMEKWLIKKGIKNEKV